MRERFVPALHEAERLLRFDGSRGARLGARLDQGQRPPNSLSVEASDQVSDLVRPSSFAPDLEPELSARTAGTEWGENRRCISDGTRIFDREQEARLVPVGSEIALDQLPLARRLHRPISLLQSIRLKSL